MLFLAGDAGDGCYRVEEGLLKASVVALRDSELVRLSRNAVGSLVARGPATSPTPTAIASTLANQCAGCMACPPKFRVST